jgi:serine/threonine protein kinase
MKLCPACQRCYEDTDVVCSVDSTPLVPSRHGSRIIAGKYSLEKLLGRGGMGAVYAGTHLELERMVAIKLLLPDFTADPEALERFRREARAAARLNHPHVADTYDYGALPEGGAYIVMELIEGETLRERLDASGRLPFDEAVQIARQVTSGVEAAHRSGITHRDLKPSNIILTRDHDGLLLAKVVDFSVAKLKEGTTSGAALTATGSLIGTPRYMAPEQCADNKTDARSDIYSLGVILYEMLAGRAPFEGPTTTAIAIKHIQEPPPPLEEFRPDTPASLRRLIEQALAKAPSERPQTAQEFAARLDQAARDLPSSAVAAVHSSEAVGTARQSSAARPTHETNPQKQERDSDTERAGEPTREDQITDEHSNAQPSVQSYAVTLGETLEEQETKVSARDVVESPRQAEQAKETVAETTRMASPKVEGPAQTESGFPLLSEHSKTVPQSQSSSSNSAQRGAAPHPTRPNYLPYALAAGILLLLGLGALMLAYRGMSARSADDDRAASASNGNGAGVGTVNPVENKRTGNQALSDPNQSPSPAPSTVGPRDAQAELQSLRDLWVKATVERDLNRMISFYPPVVETFYLRRNVPRSAVRNEKQRMIEQATDIDLQTSQPETKLSADGQLAIMTFRKSWNFRGQQNSSGEVIQELRWAKTAEGWKIISERDISVIR